MKVVAVVSAVGGAGGTTVTANLAAGLVAQQRRPLCFDFCPDNLLRLHFGSAWSEPTGLGPALLARQPWHVSAFRGAGGVDFVPFGQLRKDADLGQVSGLLAAEPGWFGAQLAGLHVDPDTIVICDVPRGHPALRDQVLRKAALVLLVCAPDPVSYAFATKMLSNAKAADAPATMIVLNGFDSARRLDRDIAVLLRTGFKKHLSPVVVHRDEFVRESLACKQTVFEFAPSSRAAHDFAALSTWVAGRLGHTEKRIAV